MSCCCKTSFLAMPAVPLAAQGGARDRMSAHAVQVSSMAAIAHALTPALYRKRESERVRD